MLKTAIMLESFSVGGAQRVVSELVKNLDKTQIDLRVICCEERVDTAMAREIEKVAQVVYLNTNGQNILKRFKIVFKYLKEFRPDVVNTHLTPQLYAVPWGILHKKPIIITAHTKPEKAFVKKIEFLIRWALRHSKLYIVAVSQENLRLIKNYFGVDESRCCYINNGIDIDAFYREEHENFTFINVARQDENKNQAAIIRCFAQLHKGHPDTRLILLGDGPCHDKLCGLRDELGLKNVIELPGSKSNVADYYARADVYVQASHREAMPMSVLEAMAAGLPIISTDVGGMRDVVQNNGYLYEDNDDDSLYDYMKNVLLMPRIERESLSLASKKKSEQYSSKSMAELYLGFYRKVGM